MIENRGCQVYTSAGAASLGRMLRVVGIQGWRVGPFCSAFLSYAPQQYTDLALHLKSLALGSLTHKP